MYGVFVSPFYVENYVKIYWNQSMGYCRFFEFYFTFHDFFVPLVLILLSTYISLKYSGATAEFRSKKTIYLASFDQGPPTIQNDATDDKKECRTLDVYTMVFSYFLGSSFLFCFTMSFLFSLCIVGSPYLRDVIDEEE